MSPRGTARPRIPQDPPGSKGRGKGSVDPGMAPGVPAPQRAPSWRRFFVKSENSPGVFSEAGEREGRGLQCWEYLGKYYLLSEGFFPRQTSLLAAAFCLYRLMYPRM